MDALAVVLQAPEILGLAHLDLTPPTPDDVVVEIAFSGISTGTEKLLWSGRMPPFPGMGYPLVPGYESVGQVVEAGAQSGRKVGDVVFVPGANCYGPVRGLFGGAASRIVLPGRRVAPVAKLEPESALLALAATARHALALPGVDLPDLVVGHGVLGRLIARLIVAAGGAPTVWELSPVRMSGASGYQVCHPDDDPRRDYRCICDVSGDAQGLDRLIARLAPGGQVVLAGFYPDPVAFNFPMAFLREASIRIAAEWKPADMVATQALVAEGFLSLDGLITHQTPAVEADSAYRTAFTDPACLKQILDWRA